MNMSTMHSRMTVPKESRIQSRYPISNDTLMVYTPSVFAEEAHGSRSDRYTYIPTIDIVEGLRKEGFFPFFACQSKALNEERRAFAKHMLRFRREDAVIDQGEFFEVVLINSHDGTSSYQMMAGVFRMVCSNGMIAGDLLQAIKVPHRGNILDGVVGGAYELTQGFDRIAESREVMKSIQLTGPEQAAFGKAALALRYEENKSPITPSQVITPNRWQDNKKDLWSTFNVVQENLTKGGQRGVAGTGRRIRTREVKGIDSDIKLNKSLWLLADEMARLKA